MSNESTPVNPTRSAVVTAAISVAFLLVLVSLLYGLQHPLAGVFSAIVPLFAGIGLWRRRVWAGYGYALVQAAQGLVLIAVAPGGVRFLFWFASLFSLFVAILFLFAARSLAHSGAPRGWAWPWIVWASLATIPFLFLRPFAVPTGSMENTLLVGDRIMVRVFPKVSVSRGDVIVFRFPTNPKESTIKRVVGLPGDRIRIVSSVVYLNGAILREPYVVHKMRDENAYRDNLPHDAAQFEQFAPSPEMAAASKEMMLNHVVNGDVVVPAGKYFVLGDNRDNSLDGRYFGFVDQSDIIGKPLFVYDSEEPSRLAGGMPKTRWNRLFKGL